MTNLRNPHDHFFKALFSRQEAAQEFLELYLPSDVANLLDLTTLQIRKDSFVDSDLQEHFSDLLYQVAFRTGSETYIYILFEHKSYPEPEIAFQLLRYLVRIWEQDRKQHNPLRPILPLVIYHGQQTWRVPLNFAALFDLPEALQRYHPTFEYQLYDLSRYSDEDIQGQIILRVSLLLLKYILQEDFGQQFKGMVNLLQELSRQKSGLEYLKTLLTYVAGGTDKISRTEFVEIIQTIFNQGDNLMPTIAEQWIKQGREEGREATLKVLRRFLSQRFNVTLDYFDSVFEVLDLPTIDQLSDTAFEAKTLAEFEAVLAAIKAKAEVKNDDVSTQE